VVFRTAADRRSSRRVTEILTERLRLRPFRNEDLSAFVAYRRAPEVARYQSWDTSYSMVDAERFLADQDGLELGRPGVWVQLAALERTSGTLCGDCAVRVIDGQCQAEVGVTFAPEHQGRGLAWMSWSSKRVLTTAASASAARLA
jgi:RimJ/RimL family protein N-acetyltransferase